MPAKRSPALFEQVLKAIARLEANFDTASKRKIMAELATGMEAQCKPVPNEDILRLRVNTAVCFGVAQGVLAENSGRVRMKVGPLAILKNDEKERRFIGGPDPNHLPTGNEGIDHNREMYPIASAEPHQCAHEDQRAHVNVIPSNEQHEYDSQYDDIGQEDDYHEEGPVYNVEDDQDHDQDQDGEEQQDCNHPMTLRGGKRPRTAALHQNTRGPDLKRLKPEFSRRTTQARKQVARDKRRRHNDHSVNDAANKRPVVLDHFRNKHYQNSSIHTVDDSPQDLCTEDASSKARSPKIKVVKF